jgi:hypothetical protein
VGSSWEGKKAPRRHIRALATAVAGAIALLFSCGEGISHAATAGADFNGDGYADLALGNEAEDVASASGAGAVRVLYGSAKGPSLKGDLYLTEATKGMKGDGPGRQDFFGSGLAAGDFNGDGYDDLAIGAPGASLGAGKSHAGAVYVLYGSRGGLKLKGSQYLTQDTPGIKGDGAEDSDGFGGSLVAARFNGDGSDDLAIGSPGECLAAGDCPGGSDGAVNVLCGGKDGLRTHGGTYLTESMPGMKGADRSGNLFGWALAAGDFDADGFADLAIGAPEADVSGHPQSGALHVLYGSRHGITLTGNRYLTQASAGMAGPGAVSCCDEFGLVLAAGRLNADRRADLAVGLPYQSLPPSSFHDQGAVIALYGGAHGLGAKGSQFLTQGTKGMAGPGAQEGGQFGWSLAIGDLDGDRRGDLVVGTPLADGSARIEGAATVVYGAKEHLTTRGSQYINEENPAMKGPGPKPGDLFGWSVGVADLNGDRRGDLSIGAPQNPFGERCPGGGAVHVLFGRRSGVRMKGNRYLTANTPGIAGPGAQRCAGFGQTILGG